VADRIPGGERGRDDELTDRIGLGVLTRLVHRDLVDEVLADTGRTERRRRLLPARVVVYFVLAMTLFFDDAYEEVMRKLVDGLRADHPLIDLRLFKNRVVALANSIGLGQVPA
jgi:hypothetical protein